jgi:hypothetical protein
LPVWVGKWLCRAERQLKPPPPTYLHSTLLYRSQYTRSTPLKSTDQSPLSRLPLDPAYSTHWYIPPTDCSSVHACLSRGSHITHATHSLSPSAARDNNVGIFDCLHYAINNGCEIYQVCDLSRGRLVYGELFISLLRFCGNLWS